MRAIPAHGGPILAIAYLPGQRLVSAGWDQTVALWDLTNGAELTRRSMPFVVPSLAVSPDGRVALGGPRELVVWDPVSDEEPKKLSEQQSDAPLLAVAWSRDGAYLAGVRFENTYHIWSFAQQIWRPLADVSMLWAVSFSDAGRLLLVSGGRASLADPVSGVVTHLIEASPRNYLTGALSPDGCWAALGGFGGDLDVRATDGTVSHTLSGHHGLLLGCAFSADGQLLATASLDGVVRLWDTRDWSEWRCYDWQISTIRGLAMAPDGMTAVAAGFDGTLMVWDLD